MPALLKINSAEVLDEKEHELGVQEQILERAFRIKQELAQGATKPFRELIEANVADTSVFADKPITFIRQVTALACLPDLLSDSAFPVDVKHRVRSLLQQCQGNSIGSLTDAEGMQMVRRHIAAYIHQRDGFPANWEDIIIVPGVSAAIKILYKLINYTLAGEAVGVLTPVPEFPLFTSTLTEFGIVKVPYYLDEDDNWSVNIADVDQAVSLRPPDCCVRAFLVVNPGNPTGQILTRQNMEEIVKFANEENLLIIACEIYQDNIYQGAFHSFKKVISEMGSPYNHTELVSLMSSPKGYAGDSGMRAGYMELHNVNPSVKELLRSSIQIADSPPICAQIALDCMANPPTPGEPSYSLFQRERTSSLKSIEDRAKLVYDAINHIPGLSCHFVQSGFYAFVKVDLPDSVVERAYQSRQCPSTVYCLELMEHTGVVTVPGEGFGQKPDSHHFRISILLPEESLKVALRRIREFHLNFTNQHN